MSTVLRSILAYPSLSSFNNSIKITLMIHHSTPSWIAIGLSIGVQPYSEGSSKHLLAISNGWVCNKGSMERSKIRFQGGDKVELKWDKSQELLEWKTKGEKHLLKMPNIWN